MVNWVRRRERVEEVRYAHEFRYADDPNAGFWFDVDAAGNMLNTNPAAQANREACRSGVAWGKPVTDLGVRAMTRVHYEPAVLRCGRCGREVALYDAMTNECECGLLYNGSGQELRPREQWDDETDGITPAGEGFFDEPHYGG